MVAEVTQSIRVVDRDEAELYQPGVLGVWEQAFGPVEDAPEWSESIWDRHRFRADYRLAVAEEVGDVVGFAWGYTGELGQYWPDLVATRVGSAGERLGRRALRVRRARSCSEAQRRGLGGRLHDALVAGVPHDRALLGTSADPTDPAVALYRRRGWRQIGLLDSRTQVMGLRHPGRAQPVPPQSRGDRGKAS